MSARVDPEQIRPQSLGDIPAASLGFNSVLPIAASFDADADLGNALPADHPAWVRDAVSISQRARQVLATFRPVAIRVMTLWDHTVRSLVIGGRKIEVDASGSYRMP